MLNILYARHTNRKVAKIFAKTIIYRAKKEQAFSPVYRDPHVKDWPKLQALLIEVFMLHHCSRKNFFMSHQHGENNSHIVAAFTDHGINPDLIYLIGNWQVNTVHLKDGSIIPRLQYPIGAPFDELGCVKQSTLKKLAKAFCRHRRHPHAAHT